MKTNIKSIAYYLPQFHQIPENDEWWGEGFTEWTNVKKAKPVYEGHYQPKIPYEYYDLSDPSAMHKQIAMAKQYGLYGFCFHYYWFGGKRLLEKPIENFLGDSSSDANFPFMLCWANENWTRRWDGKEEDVLISQKHSVDDHQKVTEDWFRYFQDERYIKIQGKPVIVIYRPSIIDEFEHLVKILRKSATENGFPGIHIVSTNSFYFTNEDLYDIDAIVEFPPHLSKSIPGNAIKRKRKRIIEKDFRGMIYDYKSCKNANLENYKRILSKEKKCAYYPTTFPSWDNTARKQYDSHICADTNPQDFGDWLSRAMKFTTEYNTQDDNFVFINAWNEWAEGAVLEPDEVNGFDNLNALKTALKKSQTKIKAYQIYYDESQKDSLVDGFIPYFNEKATVNLESGIICDLVNQGECSNCDWFGVFSWKIRDKIKGLDFERLKTVVEENGDCDLLVPDPSNYLLGGIRKPHRIQRKMNTGKGQARNDTTAKDMLKLLLKRMIEHGIVKKPKRDFVWIIRDVAYFNAFLAKPSVYKDYVNSLLMPTIDLIKSDKELYEKMTEYTPNYDSPPRNFVKDTGLEYYPHLPFILERFINLYIDLNVKDALWYRTSGNDGDLKVGWVL
jgi:hypothetical protein